MSDVLGASARGSAFRSTHTGLVRRKLVPSQPQGEAPDGEWRRSRGWRHTIGGGPKQLQGAEAAGDAGRRSGSRCRDGSASGHQEINSLLAIVPQRASSLDPSVNLQCDLSVLPPGGSFPKGSLSASARHSKTRLPSQEEEPARNKSMGGSQTRWNPQRSPGQPVDRWHGRLPEVPGSVTSRDVSPAPQHPHQQLPSRDNSSIKLHASPEIQTGEDAQDLSSSFAAFAELLVERCGSLLRAFNYFDYNRSGKVTRSQWVAGLSSLHIDLQGLCGMSTKQVFKMMDGISGAGTSEVQFEKWTLFFEQHLTDTEHEHLLHEDRGDMRSRRGSQSSQASSRGSRPSFGHRAAEDASGRAASKPQGPLRERPHTVQPMMERSFRGETAAIFPVVRDFKSAERRVPKPHEDDRERMTSRLPHGAVPSGTAQVSVQQMDALQLDSGMRYQSREGSQAGKDAVEAAGKSSSRQLAAKEDAGTMLSSRPSTGFGTFKEDAGMMPSSRPSTGLAAGGAVKEDAGMMPSSRPSTGLAAGGAVKGGSGTIASSRPSTGLAAGVAVKGDSGTTSSSRPSTGLAAGGAVKEDAGTKPSSRPSVGFAADGNVKEDAGTKPSSRPSVGFAADGNVKEAAGTKPSSRPSVGFAADGNVKVPETVEAQMDAGTPAAGSEKAEDPATRHGETEGTEGEESFPLQPFDPAETEAISESLLQALAAPTAELDLFSLNKADVEAVLQQEELSQDLKHLDLSGVEALAYILIAKLGSLKRAFDWFDTHRKGKFSHVVWDTGMVLLRIDVEKLTGFKAAQIFGIMDGNPSNGFVSRKEWNRFFEAMETGSLAEAFNKTTHERGTIAERAKRRADCLEKERPKRQAQPLRGKPKRGQRRSSAQGEGAPGASAQEDADCSGPDPEEDARYQEEEDSFRERARQALGALVPGEALTYVSARDTFTKLQSSEHAGPLLLSSAVQERREVLSPEEKCDIVEEVAEELDMWVVSSESATSKVDLSRSSTMALSPGSLDESGAAVLVCHLRSFAEETRDQLKELKGTHGSMEFAPSLTRTQRFVVHALAAQLDLTTLSEGSGVERHIVAYDLGDFAQDLRRILLTIGAGETKALSEKLSAAQQQLVRTMASEMGLSVSVSGRSGLQVCNLQRFKDDVQQKLLQISSGEVVDFGSTLSEQERQVVLDASARLGLTSQTQGRSRVLQVADLRDFLSDARADLEALKNEPEKQLTFGPPLTNMELVALQDLATEVGLRFARRMSPDGATLVVSMSEIPPPEDVDGTRPRLAESTTPRMPGAEKDGSGSSAVVATSSTSRELEHATQASDDGHEGEEEGDLPTLERDSQESLISEVFEAYSSGNHRGQRTFLRFSDLREFAEDLREVMPEVRKTFHRFIGELENIYDDTQQLQCDMGDHSVRGLTFRFFQVFVQKVIRRLGPSIVGVLCALVEGRDRI